jgi:hypothetical protein
MHLAFGRSVSLYFTVASVLTLLFVRCVSIGQTRSKGSML